MRTIREFEERLHVEFAAGDIPGFVHLYAGEEAVGRRRLHAPERRATTSPAPIAATATASPRAATSTAMMAEIYGRKDGLCNGKGGSMHIADLSQGHARRQRHRRRRPAARLRRGADREDAARPAASASPSSATAPPTRARSSRAFNLAAIWNLPASSSSRTTATPSRPPSRYVGRRQPWPSAPTASACRASGRRLRLLRRLRGGAARRSRARAPAAGPTLLDVKLIRFFGHFEGDAHDLSRARTRSTSCAREQRLPEALPPARDRGRRCSRPTSSTRSTARSQRPIDAGGGRGQGGAATPTEADLLTDVYVDLLSEERPCRKKTYRAGDQRGAAPGDGARPDASSSWARTSPAARARPGEQDAWGGALGVTKGLFARVRPRARARHADHRERPSSARRSARPPPACARSPS